MPTVKSAALARWKHPREVGPVDRLEAPARQYVGELRPAYVRPTMKQVRRVPPNGLSVVSLFTGAGGSCLGFRMAGFRVLWANEFVPAAAETYRKNFPGVPPVLDRRDLREIDPAEILKAIGKKAGEVDLLEGSPPCAGFSTAGKLAHSWGKKRAYSDVEQRVDDLFAEYARIVAGVRPRVFVAENVAGFARGVSVGHFNAAFDAFKALGYDVAAKMLDAQWLGVPQRRRRVFIVGVREDLGRPPVFPKPLPYRFTLADVLPGIACVVTKHAVTLASEPAPTVQTHGRRRTQSEFTAIECGASIESYAIGEEWARLRPGQWSRRFTSLVRPKAGEPCPTVTMGAGNPSTAGVTHPTEPRKFSISELKAICGFPDDFALTGTYAQQWERLGRAVPPPMAYHVARALREGVFS